MRNSKTLYTDNGFKKYECFDDFDVLKIPAQSDENRPFGITNTIVIGESVVGQDGNLIEMGKIGKYLKMINPRANKAILVKNIKFNISAFALGNNDATEEIPEMYYSLLLFRSEQPPADGDYDTIKRGVQNNDLIPLVMNKRLNLGIVYETLADEPARYDASIVVDDIDVMQYAIQPLGLLLILYDHLVEGNAAVTAEYSATAIIRYNVETLNEKLFRRMVEAYTGISPDIERRPTLPIGQ